MYKITIFFSLIFAPFTVFADNNRVYCVNNIYYKLLASSDNVQKSAMVIGPWAYDSDYQFPSGDIIIPEYINIEGETYFITAIDDEAFQSVGYDSKIILPNGLKTIGKWSIGSAFSPGGHYTRVANVPESIEIIDEAAFGWTTLPDTIDLPDIQFIGSNAFMATNTKYMRLGSNLRAIHSYAFEGSEISELVFDDGSSTFYNDIDSYYLSNCPYLSNYSFKSMAIKELKLPKWNNMAIGDAAVWGNPELERVIFPDVETIEYGYAFYFTPSMIIGTKCCGCFIAKCEKIKEVVCMGENPPEITNLEGFKYRDIEWEGDVECFNIVDNMEGCVLKVPAGSEELYRADPVWGRFQTILGFETGDYDLVSINSVEADENSEPVYYNLQGIQVKEPVKGQLYIRKAGSETTKVIL